MVKLKLVQEPYELRAVVEKLAQESMVGVDTEFVRERTFYPKIALIQVAAGSEVWLIDPLAFDRDAFKPLLEVFIRKDIVKVMHAAFGDQECLYWGYGCIAEPVLDTAVGAAMCGYGDNAGLGNLLKDILGISVPKGRARVKWLARPLPKELMDYASNDVRHLVTLGLRIQKELDRFGRLEWAFEESRVSASLFDIPPEELAERATKSGNLDFKTESVLFELVLWREKRARVLDLPRNWVADIDTLRSLAKARPSTIEELRSFRGLNEKEVSRNGERILDAVNKGVKASSERKRVGTVHGKRAHFDENAVDLVKAYINYLAIRHRIAPRFLLSVSQIGELMLERGESSKNWVKNGLITHYAEKLVGSELEGLLKGNVALSLDEGRMVEVSVPR